jgi:hypothetical protein
MSRITRISALLFVAAPLVVGACKKAEEPAPVNPPAAASPAIVITEVKVGRDVNAQKRVEAAMEAIGTRDDFHVSVVTDGKGEDVPIVAKWMDPAGTVIRVDTTRVSADGPEATELSLSRDRAWTAGTYKVEVTLGSSPSRTVEFVVR